MDDKLLVEGVKSKGFGIIPKSVMQDRNIHPIAKAIYSYFCSYAGAGDMCFPTRKKICYDMAISIDTFSKYLRQLIENGYLKCEQIKENGRFSHNVYTILDTKSPCPIISDTVKNESEITVSENTVYDRLDTNNNNNNNNSNIIIKEKSKKEKGEKNIPQTEADQAIAKIKNMPDKEISDKLLEIIKNKQRKNCPVTKETVLNLVKNLQTFSHDNRYVMIEMLDKSIEKGYTDVFEIKNKRNYNSSMSNYSAYDLAEYEKTTTGDNYQDYLDSFLKLI